MLGLPPVWYKSAAYRSRAVSDPRGVLREFGFELPAGVELRVYGAAKASRRHGTLGEDELAKLVTRDSMIGTTLVTYPSAESISTK